MSLLSQESLKSIKLISYYEDSIHQLAAWGTADSNQRCRWDISEISCMMERVE